MQMKNALNSLMQKCMEEQRIQWDTSVDKINVGEVETSKIMNF